MSHRRNQKQTRPSVAKHRSAKRLLRGAALGKRARGLEKNEKETFAPPEDWYEPTDRENPTPDYEIIVQPAGNGYRHVVTPAEIRKRLAKLPSSMLEPLEFVQLSKMTRKKLSSPCYGMQWGTTLYLYPIETSLSEYYLRPPKPAEVMEARMFGARWRQVAADEWLLSWTLPALKDYYLNNVLIHELGHLLDDRNTSYSDRERYAEWFAIEHGYKKSKRASRAIRKKKSRTVRRHHSK